MWAAEETITLSAQGYSNAETVSSTSGSVVTLTYTDGGTPTAYYTTGTGVRIYAGGKMTITASGNTITAVSVTHTKEKSAEISWSSEGTTTATSTATPATWTGSASSVELNVNTKGHIRMQSVTVTYTVAVKTDPTITFNDGSVRVGKTLDLSTLFTSNSTGTVTYSITSGGSYATIDGNILTGVAEGNVTVKATQAATATYNAGEATATITVQEALTLSSIAITTAPTKTTYTEGETFDATGMVVTATYSDSSTDNVTALCSWTPSGALTTSDSEITVSYTENGTTKTATQSITVNEYVQATTVNIDLNNAFFGTSFTGANAKGSGEHSGTANRVTVNFISGGDKNNFYINDDEIRAYSGNTLEFEAPTGYVITKIVFDNGSNWNVTASVGTLSTATWTGSASSIEFSASSRSDFYSATVTLAPTVAISSARYATYCSPHKLDFSTSGVTVYMAKSTGTSVTLTEVTDGIVPANAGVVLYCETAGTYAIPVTTETGSDYDAENNELIGINEVTNVKYDGEGSKKNFILSNESGVVGFYKATATGANLAAHRAYLSTENVTAARSFLGFADDETTAIKSLTPARSEGEGVVYNLNGQQVKAAKKGLYIVNGNKVVIK